MLVISFLFLSALVGNVKPFSIGKINDYELTSEKRELLEKRVIGGNVESTETVTECTKSAKMDLQLIVDSSKSVGPDNFNTMMKKIADEVIDQFNIGQDATRVALYKYSSYKVMANEFGLGKYSNAAQLEARVKATKFEPGWTLTGLALKKALKQYTKESRKGEDTAKVCMVFTDGQANDAAEIPAATKAWAKAGVKVFAIGIGSGIDRKGLEAIAGDDDERVLQVKDFEAIGEMANSLLVKVCKQIKIPHPCDTKSKGGCEQICIKEGKYAMCLCKAGFKLAVNKKNCVKVHPCDTEANGGCSQICKTSGAAAICACKSGFQLGKDKKSCTKRVIDVSQCSATGERFRDPDDCGVFWVCDHIGTHWAKVHRFNCPAGLHWNIPVQTCDWPGNVDCS